MKCFLWNILCHFLFIDWVLTKVLEVLSFPSFFSLAICHCLAWMARDTVTSNYSLFFDYQHRREFRFFLALSLVAFRSSLWRCAWRRLCNNVGSMSVSLASFSLIQLPIRWMRDTLRLKFQPKNSNEVYNLSSSSSWSWINFINCVIILELIQQAITQCENETFKEKIIQFVEKNLEMRRSSSFGDG